MGDDSDGQGNVRDTCNAASILERLALVRRTDAYSRPRWTLGDVEAVEALLRERNEALAVARKALRVLALRGDS